MNVPDLFAWIAACWRNIDQKQKLLVMKVLTSTAVVNGGLSEQGKEVWWQYWVSL